jgi:hypothetical protein
MSRRRRRHETTLILLEAVAAIFFLTLESGLVCAQTAPGISPEKGEREETIFDDRRSTCQLRQLPDSPTRAVRQADGEIVLFTTFENNWFMDGRDWTGLKAHCASAGRGAENPDPNVVDDKYWIQALHTLDGKSFIALGSHEYLGGRHPGKCKVAATKANPFPCWYSSITQYYSRYDAKHFLPPKANYIVARPQIPFDPTKASRVGFFTTSNIVSDGRYRYVLVYSEGAEGQEKGNCLFRSALTPEPSKWWGWGGSEFSVDLSALSGVGNARPSCRPVSGLDREIRGLVRHRPTGTWIAIYTGRDGDVTGVFYSVSKDMIHWSRGANILSVAVARTEPDCPPVYRYPSIIDHDAPGFSFDTIGNKAFLYSVKIIFVGCRHYSGRQVVRIPLMIELVR